MKLLHNCKDEILKEHSSYLIHLNNTLLQLKNDLISNLNDLLSKKKPKSEVITSTLQLLENRLSSIEGKGDVKDNKEDIEKQLNKVILLICKFYYFNFNLEIMILIFFFK